jgi:transmembrane sensor
VPVAEKVAQDTPTPSGQQVILTLGNGQQVLLADNAAATQAMQADAAIVQASDSQLVYQAGAMRDRVVYNKIQTPNGKQFSLQLSDGSKIWLNAASAIRFPTHFHADIREVELLAGEAYFEVAKRTSQPFMVKVHNAAHQEMTVQVLGTHFNISAYAEDDEVKTTLVEGSVLVKAGVEKHKLQPGWQARMGNHSLQERLQIDKQVDLSMVTGWRHGMFYFRNADPMSVLRTIARWYDVKLAVNNVAGVGIFNGELERTTPISTVVHLLNESGFKIKLQGNTLSTE